MFSCTKLILIFWVAIVYAVVVVGGEGSFGSNWEKLIAKSNASSRFEQGGSALRCYECTISQLILKPCMEDGDENYGAVVTCPSESKVCGLITNSEEWYITNQEEAVESFHGRRRTLHNND